jgi:acyl-CoA thioester hydrolase
MIHSPQREPLESHRIKIAARYYETDQSGVVHHSVYPMWFEMGRTELLRANGLVYKKFEEEGMFFVVVELHVRYHLPARYDEELELETTSTRWSRATQEHSYRLTRCQDGALLTEGSTVLACVNRSGQVRRIPRYIYESVAGS